MTGLDLFPQAQRAVLIDASQNAARDLPAEFSEAFDISFASMTQFHNSTAYGIAQKNAIDDYVDDLARKSGQRLTIDTSDPERTDYLDLFNTAQSRIAASRPDLELQPLTDDSLRAMTLAKMAKAYKDTKDFEKRETTYGGTLGSLAGTLGGALADPVTLATLPLGGAGEAGIALRALEFAVINGSTEAAIAALNYRDREAAVPGSSKDIPGEIASATIFGGVLGGAFGALGKLLRKGGETLPTSLREEVNAAASEAQLVSTNPFPGAAGELAARDAGREATEALLRGEPVRAGEGFDAAFVADLAKAARAETPDALAAAGEKHLRPETFGEKIDAERFDPLPRADDDVASYYERRLGEMSAEERRAIGATDDVVASRGDVNALDVLPATGRDLSRAEIQKLAADPMTDEAVLRNLDRIRLEKPDADFSVQVRQQDGNYSLVTRKLEDVLDEIDGLAKAGKELEACATGLIAAE